MATVAETIRETTREHLLSGKGKLFGQCVSAVGWVGGTIPELTEKEGIVELALSDCSNAGMPIGAALAGTRPIYVVRYQGFLWYNAVSLINYAAKSKEMWGVSCPVFIRAIAMEGNIGPVATSSEHSMVMRKPGMAVYAPMTSGEWLETYEYFMANTDPMFCSEHRKSFALTGYPVTEGYNGDEDITIFAISAARLSAQEAQKELIECGIKCNIFPVWKLKPLGIPALGYKSLYNSGIGLVIDSDNEICGASEHIANHLMMETRIPVHTLGVQDRTAGFAAHLDNGTPTAEMIVRKVRDIVESK
ncbi:MAG: hypothetical protein KKB59_19760 [Spirochaetes bacterium]|nr:hypothetical protein [Spirochaetota bacterium]